MAPLLCVRNIAVKDRREPLTLELEPGGQTLCITADEQELRHLLHLCCGMALPSHDQVLLDGIDTAALSRQQLLGLRRGFGIVTATGGLIANLKLWENITLPCLYRQGSITPEDEQQAMELLIAFGYTGNLLALPGHLSLFERRMAAFVRAAISRPRLMLYAGCFDNLTTAHCRLLLQQARQLHENIPGLASLYLTTSSTALETLHPDCILDLQHRSTTPERSP